MRDVVLGLGGCLDYEIVWDPGVLAALAESYGVRLDQADSAVAVRDERDLVRSVLGFVRDGADFVEDDIPHTPMRRDRGPATESGPASS